MILGNPPYTLAPSFSWVNIHISAAFLRSTLNYKLKACYSANLPLWWWTAMHEDRCGVSSDSFSWAGAFTCIFAAVISVTCTFHSHVLRLQHPRHLKGTHVVDWWRRCLFHRYMCIHALLSTQLGSVWSELSKLHPNVCLDDSTSISSSGSCLFWDIRLHSHTFTDTATTLSDGRPMGIQLHIFLHWTVKIHALMEAAFCFGLLLLFVLHSAPLVPSLCENRYQNIVLSEG